jgi:hypothetical protein
VAVMHSHSRYRPHSHLHLHPHSPPPPLALAHARPGEYIVSTREGEYAIFVDSQTWGPASTGGNFGLIKLAKDF